MGRVALITGAGRGIGRTVARELAGRGMLVAINDYDPVTAQAAADELTQAGARAIAIPADVSSKGATQELVERVEVELGPLWLLVYNAGVLNSGPTATLEEEKWDHAFAVDAKGVFLVSQAAIQRMILRGAGRIVVFSSIAGTSSGPPRLPIARQRPRLSTSRAALPWKWPLMVSLLTACALV